MAETNQTEASPTTAWHVALPRNADFAGRDDFLRELRARLLRPDAAHRTQVLQGVAGIGKSQIALEFAWRNREQYDLVAWIRGGDQAMLEGDLARLAVAIGAAPSDASPAAAIASLREALRRHDRWLIVLDHFVEPKWLPNLLPDSPGGHVIVTSRLENWRNVATVLPVGPFTRDESIFFLRKGSMRDDSLGDLSRLAKALADHPMALKQAVTVIDRDGITSDEYITRLEGAWADLLRRGRPSSEYPEAIAMSWEVLALRLREKSVVSECLLNLICHFGDDPIPLPLLSGGAFSVTQPLAETLRDPQLLRTTIFLLEQHAIVQRAESNSIRLAALLGAMARFRLTSSERKNWALMSLNTAAAAFEFDANDLRTWAVCDAVLPHALAAAGYATDRGVGIQTAADLLNQAGHCLYRRAQYYRASAVLERAMMLGLKAYGDANPRLSAISNNHARVLMRLGDVQAARERFEWALALDEQAYGPAHPHVAEILNNLAIALLRCDDHTAARERLAQALSISTAHYGPEHPSVGSILNNLGYVLMVLKDLDGASEQLNRALAVCEATLGRAHPDVAAVLNNLGELARARKDWPGAENYHEQALAISRVAYGPNHPDVARDLGNLGSLMLETRRPSVARHHFERALAIDEATFGPKHPAVASRLEELSRAMKATDDVDGSVRCLERAREIRRIGVKPKPAAINPRYRNDV